jgi:hypothetical protein
MKALIAPSNLPWADGGILCQLNDVITIAARMGWLAFISGLDRGARRPSSKR